MQKLSRSLYKLPVIALHDGGAIAVATEPIINPHNLKIIGWRCKENGLDSVLLSEEVRSMSADGLMINNESALAKPEELARHQEVLEMKFQLMGKLVKTKSHKIGKVTDFNYDDESMMVMQLYVEPPLTRLFGAHDTRLISRQAIKEIADTYILVSDSDVEAKEPTAELAADPEVPLAETA